MMNDIQVTIENQTSDANSDDNWCDDMRKEYEDRTKNSYDCGPGADLDLDMQCPTYRDKNNQPVWKLFINRFPKGLTEEGLKNLLALCGNFNVIFSKHQTKDQLIFSIVECKTLREAKNAILNLDEHKDLKLRVKFAKSDAENARLKKERKEGELFYRQNCASAGNKPESPRARQESSPNLRMLRMLGRGNNRGRLIVNAHREYCERQAGARSCVWSNGNPDVRDPGGLIYKYKSNRHDASNRYLLKNMESIVVTSSDSARKVSMGRGYVPPVNESQNSSSSCISLQKRIGEDIQVPLLPCSKCSSDTVLKCLKCGTPYCSTKCQREDFNKHRPMCHARESVDVPVNESLPQKVAPLTRKIAKVDPISSPTSQQDTLFWGKPEKCVLSKLRWGTEAIIEVTSHHNAHFSGFLCCTEVYDIAEKLLMSLPNLSKNLIKTTTFWPPVGTLVAVCCDDSVWRGYIINAPIIGSSTQFTVALCDVGKLQTVDAKDVFPLPSEYQSLLELSVTCTFVTSQSELLNSLKVGTQLTIKVECSTDMKATAKVLNPEGVVIGEITIIPWEPTSAADLLPVPFTPPCQVLLSAFHHQHSLYVRPIGRVFEEQFFSLMQKVAAVHVTSPPLGRPPYREEMVACQFRKDGNFYRAVIFAESQTTPQEYSAFFVDFGNIESVSRSEMKALPDELKKLPCMAVKVSLKNVRNGPLTENAVQLLNMVLQKGQELRLECPHHSEDGVELIRTIDGVNLNSRLDDFLMPDWEHLQKDKLESHQGEVFMLEDNTNILPLCDGASGVVNVFVCNLLMDGRLAVCPTEPAVVEHVLQTLAFQINEYCESTDPHDTYNPRVNEICLARFKDGSWYRAVNMRTFSNSCEVLFLDYGNMETIEFKNIRRIVRDFINSPTIMSLCSIDGLPAEPAESMVKRLSELVPVNKTLEVHVLQSISPGEYRISIPEISNLLKSEFST